mmetsp:Transcript_44337/g.104976  ORF Transcript_44337/g.104976 Transcript_44337/m.104976 type:complete len:227 (-) Transcript_44337:113-793(-)
MARRKTGGRAPQQPMAQSEEEAEEIATPSETGTQGGQVGPRAAAGGAGAVAPEAEKAENLKPRAGTSDLEAEESRGLDQGHGGDLDQRRGKGTEGNVRLPGRDLVGGAPRRRSARTGDRAGPPRVPTGRRKKAKEEGTRRVPRVRRRRIGAKVQRMNSSWVRTPRLPQQHHLQQKGRQLEKPRKRPCQVRMETRAHRAVAPTVRTTMTKVLDRASSSTSSEEYAIE